MRAAIGNRQDKQRSRDLDAYKRLRADGLQPPATAGADRLEAVAQCEDHITTGLLHADPSNQRTYVHPRAFEAFHETFERKATEAA